MDASIQRALNDRVYERRKAGALEVEKVVREALVARKWDKISAIVDQLVHDFAYAIHQPYARNGGLIGLAAASIALGPEVIRYVREIVPPVLACFRDQDARVRYYACESMYNIAKTTKGEILPYFNELFDALSKLAADSELSVKNGSELLDRLLKDIISNSATTYISILPPDGVSNENKGDINLEETSQHEVAFSLPKLIPLLEQRILVIHPFTRMFLVEWITLLDSIPDLYLVTYLPSFLKGLFRFLSDTNSDVVTATQHILERFLNEMKVIAQVKSDISEKKKERFEDAADDSVSGNKSDAGLVLEPEEEHVAPKVPEDTVDDDAATLESDEGDNSDDNVSQGPTLEEYIPGQDVPVDHPKILNILIKVLGDTPEEHIQLTALKWIDSFFDICPGDITICAPELLTQVLPALSSDGHQVRQAGEKVNSSLMAYVASLPDDEGDSEQVAPPGKILSAANLSVPASDRAESPTAMRSKTPEGVDTARSSMGTRPATEAASSVCCQDPALDYEGCVNSLTEQFLDEHEATRIASLSWLIMLQRKAPKRVLAAHDGTFPALLKTLSDPSDQVVTRDLQLLSQISQHSDETFFTNFMVNLLKLFCTDKQLLQTRGNLIIRQLCTSLSPERIYRTMADCLEKDEDTDFATTMVQNLNNNLITAPELADLRRKLRHWDSRDGPSLFVALFKAWCHNAVATLSLCLLAQAYEQAYNILQNFADIEMTVNTLIQVDKLIQLLESPIFTYLRLHLLEPTTYPHLYKTMYGILMLLPQSAAFASLKNRLNAVSAIGYLSMPAPQIRAAPTPANASNSSSSVSGTAASATAFERANRLKPAGSRDMGDSQQIRWVELLDRFKSVQERSRRAKHSGGLALWNESQPGPQTYQVPHDPGNVARRLLGPVESSDRKGKGTASNGQVTSRPNSSGGDGIGLVAGTRIPALAGRWEVQGGPAGKEKEEKKSRFSASQLGRKFGGGHKDKEKEKGKR